MYEFTGILADKMAHAIYHGTLVKTNPRNDKNLSKWWKFLYTKENCIYKVYGSWSSLNPYL